MIKNIIGRIVDTIIIVGLAIIFIIAVISFFLGMHAIVMTSFILL